MKNFLKNLLQCETSKEVIDLLATYEGGQSGPRLTWKPVNNSYYNFQDLNNLNPTPMRSITEKIINAQDHTLLLAAREKGIDPRSPSAPQSMEEACEQFYGVPEGDLTNLVDKSLADHEILKKIGKNMPRVHCVISGRDKLTPSIMVVDEGEGQNNTDFEKTFLSLKASEKRDINFVQGDHSRGSQSVLAHCDFQLILSRRPDKYGGNGKVGFTLVKRFEAVEAPPEFKVTHSWYGYLLIDGVIPSATFLSEELKVLPSSKPCVPYQLPFVSGTAVKMYSYDLPKKFWTCATFDFFYHLGQNFWKLAIPLKVYESRQVYNNESAHTLHKTFWGLKALHQHVGAKLEESFPMEFVLNLDEMGEVEGTIHLFKKDSVRERHNYDQDEGILVVLGGQCHGRISSRFFKRNGIGLDLLAESLFIAMDVSKMSTRALEKLLMPDRERLKKDGEPYSKLESSLECYLQTNSVLKKWVQTRRNSLINERVAKADDSVKRILNKIITQNPYIKNFFANGNDFGTGAENGEDEGIPTRNPRPDEDANFGTDEATFLDSCRPMVGVPINRIVVVSFKSDLRRGALSKIRLETQNVEIRSKELYMGKYTAKCMAPKHVKEAICQ